MSKTSKTLTFGLSNEQLTRLHLLSRTEYKEFLTYLRGCIDEYFKNRPLISDEELTDIKAKVEMLGMKIVKDLN